MIAHTYLGIAAALVLLAAVVWLRRNRLKEVSDGDHSVLGHPFALLRQRRFSFGALCIFLYVGAEVAIGSSIVLYLMQKSVLGLGAEEAGKHVPFYWGGAMVGRFVGAYLLRLFSPGKILACDAAVVIALLLISANTNGAVSGLVAARHRTVQFHHVSDDFLAGLRRVGTASGRRVGDHLHGDRRRRHRALDHRPRRRLAGLAVRAHGAGAVLCRHPRLRGLRPQALSGRKGLRCGDTRGAAGICLAVRAPRAARCAGARCRRCPESPQALFKDLFVAVQSARDLPGRQDLSRCRSQGAAGEDSRSAITPSGRRPPRRSRPSSRRISLFRRR